MPGKDAERGSGSGLVAGACAALLAVVVGALGVAAAAVSGQRARTAADLAAVAAAQRVLAGDPAGACDVAGQVARRNGGALSACAVREEVVVVRVAVSAAGTRLAASAEARAGPPAGDGP